MKVKRKITLALAILIILAAAILFMMGSINAFLEKKVKSGLEAYINKDEKRVYDNEFQSLDINVFSGSVFLEKVTIKPRVSALDSLYENKIKGLVELDVSRLSLEGLSLYDLFINNTIEVNKLEISEADVRYLLNDSVNTEKPSTSLHDIFTEKLDHAVLHEFTLVNASLSIKKIRQPDSIYISFDSTRVFMEEAYMDRETLQKLEVFTFEDLRLDIKNIKANIIQDYGLTVDSLKIDSEKRSLSIRKLRFIPRDFDYSSMAKQFAREVYIVSIEEISISDINLFERQGKETLHIGQLNIDGPSITESTDRRWPKPMFERLLPTAQIRNIPIPLKIDTIKADSGHVVYREFMPDEKPPLELTFTETNVFAYNLTNDTLNLKSDPQFHFSANTKFMGASNLDFKASFDILSERETFHINVKLDTLPFSVMNEVTEGQINAQIDGTANSMEMDFEGNIAGSKGDLLLDYSNLKLKTFKIKETSKGEKVVSHWLVNSLINPILKSNNHKDQVNFNTGIIEYERPEDHSFFTMIWQSLKAGLVTTVMPEKRHREEKRERKEEIRESKNVD